MTMRQIPLNRRLGLHAARRGISHRTLVRLTRVAEGLRDRPWIAAEDEVLRTLVDAARWQAEWAAIAARLSPPLPRANRIRWAQANVGTWTPLRDGLLLCTMGDGDVEWEEVAAAVGPPQTAISCWSRWVIFGAFAGGAPARRFGLAPVRIGLGRRIPAPARAWTAHPAVTGSCPARSACDAAGQPVVGDGGPKSPAIWRQSESILEIDGRRAGTRLAGLATDRVSRSTGPCCGGESEVSADGSSACGPSARGLTSVARLVPSMNALVVHRGCYRR
jgi:hypothetical protein